MFGLILILVFILCNCKSTKLGIKTCHPARLIGNKKNRRRITSNSKTNCNKSYNKIKCKKQKRTIKVNVITYKNSFVLLTNLNKHIHIFLFCIYCIYS